LQGDAQVERLFAPLGAAISRPDLLMGELTATETQGYLGLVPIGKETDQVA